MTKEIRLYPHEHVELALQKRSVSGSSMSLMEFFGQSTPTGSGFWAAAAENLHERGLHTDAFDAWRAALQENADDDATRGKMAFSLEELARQEALSATLLDGVGLYEIVGLWRCVARILEWSGHRERALDAVHKALHLDLDVDWDYGVDLVSSIELWQQLGEAYLDVDRPAKALRAFAEGIEEVEREHGSVGTRLVDFGNALVAAGMRTTDSSE